MSPLLQPRNKGGSLLRENATKAKLPTRLRKRRPAHQICHSTKRTHRFLINLSMEVSMVRLVRQEIHEGNRWVRFRKRTHRRGVLVGFGCRGNYFSAFATGKQRVAFATGVRRVACR